MPEFPIKFLEEGERPPQYEGKPVGKLSNDEGMSNFVEIRDIGEEPRHEGLFSKRFNYSEGMLEHAAAEQRALEALKECDVAPLPQGLFTDGRSVIHLVTSLIEGESLQKLSSEEREYARSNLEEILRG